MAYNQYPGAPFDPRANNDAHYNNSGFNRFESNPSFNTQPSHASSPSYGSNSPPPASVYMAGGANGRPQSTISALNRQSTVTSMASKTLYMNEDSRPQPPGGQRMGGLSGLNPFNRKEKKRLQAEAIAAENARREQEERDRQAAFEIDAAERRHMQQEIERNQQRMAELELEHQRREAEERLRRQQEESKRQQQIHHENLRIAEYEQRIRTTEPEALRKLRELIRTRYELDMEIYRDRNVRPPMRPDVIVKMKRADAIMAEIMNVVGTWNNNTAGVWTAKEWELASEIKKRLLESKKRRWEGKPPWEDDM